jgi:hypothetical protein
MAGDKMEDKTNINVNLPVVPEVDDPILFAEALRIYIAIRTLARYLDEYTAGGQLALELQIAAAIEQAEIAALREEVRALKEELDLIALQNVNWESPGELGSTYPNTVTATDLTAKGASSLQDTTVKLFGANGKTPQAAYALPANGTDLATTQTLANAIKALLIANGLGRI